MKEKGHIQLFRQDNVLFQTAYLIFPCGEHPVKVQPALPHRDHPVVSGEQGFQQIEILFFGGIGVVRMDSRCPVYFMGFYKGINALVFLHICSGQDAVYPSGRCPLDDPFRVRELAAEQI